VAKDNSRYIQFYTSGSAAVKVEIQEEHKWAPLPEPKAAKPVVFHVDPVAIIGFVVAVSMMILMAVGITQLNTARREVATLEGYVSQLNAEYTQLQTTYRESYDLEEVRQKALDMGMVSAESVPVNHIYITMPQIEIVEEPTFWEKTTAFLAGLFA
jgi:hypothetical protein